MVLCQKVEKYLHGLVQGRVIKILYQQSAVSLTCRISDNAISKVESVY